MWRECWGEKKGRRGGESSVSVYHFPPLQEEIYIGENDSISL